jgi:hypothetical protein
VLSFGHDLHGGSICRRDGEAMPGHHLGATYGTPAALAQPRVDAGRVEPVPAARQHPAPVARAVRLQAHAAVTAAGALLELVGRQLADFIGREAGPSSAFFLLPDAEVAGAERPLDRPDGHGDVHDEHHREPGGEEDDGEGPRHACK